MKKEGCDFSSHPSLLSLVLLLFFGVTAAASTVFAAPASDLNAVKLAIFAAIIVSATRYVATNGIIFFHIALLLILFCLNLKKLYLFY